MGAEKEDKIKITKKNKKAVQKAEAYDDSKIKSLVDQFSRKRSEAYNLDKKEIEDEYSRSLNGFKDENIDINNNNIGLSKTSESNITMLKRKYSKKKKDIAVDENNNVLPDSKSSESTINQLKRKYGKRSVPQKSLGDYERMTERISTLEQKVSKLQVFCAFQLSNLKYSSNFVNSFENIFSTDMKPEHTFPFSKAEDLDDDLSLKCEEDDMPSKSETHAVENDFDGEETKLLKEKEEDRTKYEETFSWQMSPEKGIVKKFELGDPLDEAIESDNESNLSEKAMDIVKDLCMEMESDNSMSPIKIAFNPDEDNQIGEDNEPEDNKNENTKKRTKQRKKKEPKTFDDGNQTKDDGQSEYVEGIGPVSQILSGEIPACPKCDYKPVAKSVAGIKQSVKQHIKAIHDKIKDKECAYCTYKTSHKSNLNTHIKNKHNKEN